MQTNSEMRTPKVLQNGIYNVLLSRIKSMFYKKRFDLFTQFLTMDLYLYISVFMLHKWGGVLFPF